MLEGICKMPGVKDCWKTPEKPRHAMLICGLQAASFDTGTVYKVCLGSINRSLMPVFIGVLCVQFLKVCPVILPKLIAPCVPGNSPGVNGWKKDRVENTLEL
jgi:hypothetical protein